MTSRLQLDLRDESRWTAVIEQWLGDDGTTLHLIASNSVDGEYLSRFLSQAAHLSDRQPKRKPRPGIDATGLKVDGPMSLSDICVPGPVTFAETAFTDFVDCHGTEFAGDADFHGAEFNRAVDFSDAIFRGPADFAKASFAHVADFRRTQFMQSATFDATRFDIGDFRKSRFGGAVIFDRIAAEALPGAPMEASPVRIPWTALTAVVAFGLLGLRHGGPSDASKWFYLIGVAIAVTLALGWLARPMIHRIIASVRQSRGGRLDRILRHGVVDGLLVAATALAAVTVLCGVILDLLEES